MSYNILVTIDANYIHPLKVMLKSLFFHNPASNFTIYLMHSKLSQEEVNDLANYVLQHDAKLVDVLIKDDYFSNAPLTNYYPKEMYYRLLAFRFLPTELDKILYLDPDILVINSIKELYDVALDDKMFAAAYRNRVSTTEVNKLRLRPYQIDAYYNSGVLLMNLALQREKIDEAEIYRFVEKYRWKLILPDQDILNALYAKSIKALDEILYNYDVRRYRSYKSSSKGTYNMDYVMNNTVILHFNGKKKPWKAGYSGRFHALYKHYEKQVMEQNQLVTV